MKKVWAYDDNGNNIWEHYNAWNDKHLDRKV